MLATTPIFSQNNGLRLHYKTSSSGFLISLILILPSYHLAR